MERQAASDFSTELSVLSACFCDVCLPCSGGGWGVGRGAGVGGGGVLPVFDQLFQHSDGRKKRKKKRKKEKGCPEMDECVKLID